MTFMDSRIEARPLRGEAPFALNEVFYSRTDGRGVIQIGNEIFRRVSDYPWGDLIGAPHKIIRHEDMPRGVFQLFWETIQAGDFFGGYVKNKSRDGLHYWVYAVVVPCEEGFLSARIKPTSKLFDKIAQGYADLLKAEQDGGLSPEESRDRLLDWCRELGFENYQQFAANALADELAARDQGMENAPDLAIERLRTMLANSDVLAEETRGLIDDFAAMRTIPHNLRVLASRIEPSGGPVTVLSQNYGSISQEMSNWFATHVMGKDSNFSKIKGQVSQSLFVAGVVRIFSECSKQLQSENHAVLGEEGRAHEQSLLRALAMVQEEHARTQLSDVNREAERITKICENMQRQLLGLSSTRVLCKIESARLPEDGHSLSDIIDQLGRFQQRISQRLQHISKLCSNDPSPADQTA
ncbi:PAS domain-containing protein [Phaeobacter sp. JH18-32]|uniref:PAS domain-containing protein n=1 Tax=Phaeobacter TaxID=302485 RepID=UPI003A84AB3E